ncbi:unnamed protein product [Dicrocoelium dendriticum]|nr:unnamed protein product [Dicrocoelium dendriticum]
MKAKAANSPCIILESDDIHTAWDRFRSYLSELSQIPLSGRNKTRAKPPLFDSAVRKQLNRCARCWRTCLSAPSSCTFKRYRDARNACRQHLRGARLQHEVELARIASSNPKRFFAYGNRRNNMNS